MQTKKMLITLCSLMLTSSLLIISKNANAQTDSTSRIRSNEAGQDINQMNNPHMDTQHKDATMQRDTTHEGHMQTEPTVTPDAHRENADVQPVSPVAPVTPATPNRAVKPATTPATNTAVKPAKPVTTPAPAAKPASKSTVKSDKSKEKTMYLVPDSNVVRDPKK